LFIQVNTYTVTGRILAGMVLQQDDCIILRAQKEKVESCRNRKILVCLAWIGHLQV